MVIKEMKIHTAVPEACFQAMTADECYEQIQLCLPSESLYWKISLCSAFQTLCKDTLEVRVRDGLAALGPLNLFALTSGRSLVCNFSNQCANQSQLFTRLYFSTGIPGEVSNSSPQSTTR